MVYLKDKKVCCEINLEQLIDLKEKRFAAKMDGGEGKQEDQEDTDQAGI